MSSLSRPEVIGHKPQQQALARLLRTNALPAVLIFSGSPGIGKLPLAKNVAAKLLCLDPAAKLGGCGNCKNCSMFEQQHPDLFVIDCAKREESGTEAIRSLISAISLRPYAAINRVVILNNSERLPIQSANILLKTLEEPRPGTFFILISANNSRLPKTLLSRAHTLHFNELSKADLTLLLQGRKNDAESKGLSLQDLVVLAEGTLERVDAILDNTTLWSKIRSALEKTFTGDLKAGMDLMHAAVKDKETLPESLKMMRIYARERMLEATGQDQLAWSIFLHNLCGAEGLIFERHLAALNVLNVCLIDLVRGKPLNSFTELTHGANLLEKSVV